MIFRTAYKDRPAIGVKTPRLAALFLPEDGGKMASLTDNDQREYLLQAPGDTYLRLTADGRYGRAECSGFDDMFPTIDPYTPTDGRYAGITYPDHGEICRMPSICRVSEDCVSFSFESPRFHTTFTKTVSADGDALALTYTLTNANPEPFLYLFATHCMLVGDPQAKIVTPLGAEAKIRKMFGMAEEAALNREQLAPFDPEGDAYKFYYLDRLPEGYCEYRYPSRGTRFRIESDPDCLPYLGLWMNTGSCKGYYNTAIELATAPFDTPAEALRTGTASYLPANGAVTFTIRISILPL